MSLIAVIAAIVNVILISYWLYKKWEIKRLRESGEYYSESEQEVREARAREIRETRHEKNRS